MSIDSSVDCIEYESPEYQGQAEGGGITTPKNDTTIVLTVTTAYVMM